MVVKKKYRPVYTEDQLGDNLFTTIDKLQIRVNVGVSKETGEEHDYEKENYCKVFTSGGKRGVVSELTAQAKELLIWIMYEADQAKDYFWLNRQRYMMECKIKSPTTVSLAVKELSGKFITPTKVREIYFINPNYFFNGSRISKFPENVIGGKIKKAV